MYAAAPMPEPGTSALPVIAGSKVIWPLRGVSLAMRRFGFSGPVIGTGAELVDHYGRLAEQGVERVYTWFCDFAPPDTLAEFGREVIAKIRA